MPADGSGLLDTAAAEPLSVIGFAGGGGSSVGYRMATGRAPSLACNHWLTAVLAHQRHFPATEHYCADIYDVDPSTWRPHEPIRLGWFSPDCTDHSKAKGKAPKSERIRGLGWSVIPWAKRRQIQTIFVENVEEYVQWGPVYRCPDDWRAHGVRGEVGQPIKALRGVTFRLWKRRFAQAGYWLEHREIVAATNGAYTTRKRFYAIAEYVGVERVARIAMGLEPSPINWVEPAFAPREKAEKLNKRPFRGFCEIADWSQPCPSIFLTPDEVEQLRRETGRRVQRPLVKATLRRIARGLDRFVLSSGSPFIVPITQRTWGAHRAHDVRDPLRTITSAKGGEFAMVRPDLANVIKFQENSTFTDPRDPLYTAMAGATRHGIVAASLAGLAHGDHERGGGARVRDVRDPLNTISAGGNDGAIVAGSLVRTNFHSSAATTGVRDVEEPIGTVTGDGGFGFAGAFMVPRYGERSGQEPRCASVEDPLATVVPKGNHGEVVSPLLVRQFGSARGGCDVTEPLRTVTSGGARGGTHDQFVAAYMAQGNFGMPGRGCCEPLTTIVGRGTQQQVIAAHLDTYYGEGSIGSDPDDPLRTATSKARMSLVATWLEQANTGMVGHAAGEPVSTIVGKGCTQRLVEARLALDGGPVGRRAAVLEFLWSFFGVPTQAEWDDPTGTLEARRKFGLVILPRRAERIGDAEGGPAEAPANDVWMIVDVGLRMLTVRELAAAMGLPPEHDLTRDCFDRPISKTAVTQMIGNMVEATTCAVLIRTQCPDLIPDNEDDAERRAA